MFLVEMNILNQFKSNV